MTYIVLRALFIRINQHTYHTVGVSCLPLPPKAISTTFMKYLYIRTIQILCISNQHRVSGVIVYVVRSSAPLHSTALSASLSIFKHCKYVSFYECDVSPAESRRIVRPTAHQHLHTAWSIPVCAAEQHLWSEQGLQALR